MRRAARFPLLLLAVLAGAATPSAARAQAGTPAEPLRTHAERSGWTELTPHAEVVRFYRELAARSPDARLAEVGRSREGRPLFTLTLARPAVAEPWEAHASGKPVLYIGAQVHGDEQAGKEGLMLLARDLAFGPLQPLLDDVVFVFMPQQNPDGGEAGTWGTRANRAGYNINRDYVLLVNPEARTIVDVLDRWRPHVIVDAHELTGARWYDFYALHPSNLNGPAAPRALAGGRLIEAVQAAIEAAGFSYFPYHLQPADPTRVATEGILAAEYGVRTLRSYGGARNAVTLLFESRREDDSRIGLEPRAMQQRVAMEAVARFMAEHPREVLGAVNAGRLEMATRGARWEPADSIVVAVEFASSGRVAYRMPEMRRVAGGPGFEPTGRILDLQVEFRDRAVPVLSRVRPVGYIIEPHRSDLARHMLAHGLQVERYDEAIEIDVESYRLDSVRRADVTYEGYVPRSVATTTVPRTVTIAPGAWLVRATQPMAVLAFAMLEPEDVDSFASAGWFAAEKAVGAFLPVHRLRSLPRGTPELMRPDSLR
jgi:hypothetical protein